MHVDRLIPWITLVLNFGDTPNALKPFLSAAKVHYFLARQPELSFNHPLVIL